MLCCWDLLIESHRCPFLKTAVLKADRVAARSLPRWTEVVRRAGDYDPSLIGAHLRRVGGHAPM